MEVIKVGREILLILNINYICSRVFSEWLIPAPGEPYLPLISMHERNIIGKRYQVRDAFEVVTNRFKYILKYI